MKAKNKKKKAVSKPKTKTTRQKTQLSKFALAIILLLISGTQIGGLFFPKSEFEKNKPNLTKNPNNFRNHLVLAEELIKNNRFESAEHELAIIFDLQQRNSFEKQQSIQLEKLILVKQESDPRDLKNLIQKWQKILQEKPNYRDGWLKLTVYLTKLKMKNEALKALNNAKNLDPNYEITRKTEALFLTK